MKKRILPFLMLAFLSCHKNDKNSIPEEAGIPAPDHIVFVWFENKGYSQIIGNSEAPYIQSLLSRGTLFDSAYALFHPSYPNYVAFFSGSNNGVTNNECIDDNTLTTPNLYTELGKKQLSFRWYSEDLPETSSDVCKYNYYVEKHNPTTIFANVDSLVNEQFSNMPSNETEYSQLPKVSCITPNLKNDMHDGSIGKGDAWLQSNLSKLIDWSLTHNSMVVLYFDEDNGLEGNRIPVIAIGQHVKAGYRSKIKYNHYSFTKTICSLYGVSTAWTRSVNDANTIDDIWR